MTKQICRYCEVPFEPPPKKPGYVDECPSCLHEKTAPKVPRRELELETAIEQARREIAQIAKKHKVSVEKVCELIGVRSRPE